jgi:hypothetical protein
MFRKISVFVFTAYLLVNMYGCFAIFAGTAGGVGTAAWLSGKLTQEVNASFEQAIRAAKSALASLKMEVTKETTEPKVAQIMSKYSDGKTVWIDIRKITESSSKIEVRVGAVSLDKAASHNILKRIQQYL